jgi:hypothetical protein
MLSGVGQQNVCYSGLVLLSRDLCPLGDYAEHVGHSRLEECHL